jgi:predicted nucleotide-binding protein
MARKPPTQYFPPPQLELNESATTARSKIADRVSKGEELRGRQISAHTDVERLKADRGIWTRYNALMLRNMFSTDELEREYLHSPYAGGVTMQIDVYGHGGDETGDERRSIEAEVTCLTSISERLDLVPLSTRATVAAPPVAIAPIARRTRDFTRAFVVHGHDEAARESVARFLEKFRVTPVILHEQANLGKTLIEKLEHYGDVSFAVVLLTPDDEGRPLKPADTPLRHRARQNVLLELGYFVGQLGRKNVCALHKEGLELPSDWDGVAWVGMDARGAWKLELARELKAAGFAIDMNNVS